MINVPYTIQRLFAEDSISKNFRVHFVNGEYRDLVNKDFVSESVAFNETAMSYDVLKFGLGDSSSIEFSTYFSEDLTNKEIFCAIEIDISSLEEDEIAEYGQTSEDVPYVYYRVPYGYFLVQSCLKQGKTNVQKVVAYTDVRDEAVGNSKIFKLPNLYSDLLRFGKEYDDGSILYTTREYISRAIFDSDSILYSSLRNNDTVPQRHVLDWSYDENSPIFTYQESYYSDSTYPYEMALRQNPTADVMCKQIRVGSGYNTAPFFLYLKARHIYLKTSNATNVTEPIVYDYRIDSEDETIGVESVDSKGKYLTLPYSIIDTGIRGPMSFSDKAGYYKVTWQNTIDVNSVVNQIYELISSVTNVPVEEILAGDPNYNIEGISVDELLTFLSPCIRIMNVSNWPSVDDDYNNETNKYMTFPCQCMASCKSRSSLTDQNSSTLNYKNRTIHIKDVKKTGNNYEIIVPYGIGAFAGNIDVTDSESSQYHNYDTHIEYLRSYDNSSKTDIDNMVAICIPTSVCIYVPNTAGDHSNNLPCNSSASDYSKRNIVLNELTSPEFSRWTYSYIANNRYEYYPSYLQYRLTKSNLSTSEGINDYKEYRYDVKGDAISACYIWNNVSDSTLTTLSGVKSVFSSWAEVLGAFLLYSRTTPFSLKLVIPNLIESLYPSDTLYPLDNGSIYNTVYPASEDAVITRSIWRSLVCEDSSPIAYDEILYNINDTSENYMSSIIDPNWKETQLYITSPTNKPYNRTVYSLINNYILNRLCYDDDVAYDSGIVEKNIAKILKKIKYIKVQAKIRALPFLEGADSAAFIADNYAVSSYIFSHRITGIQSLIDTIDVR